MQQLMLQLMGAFAEFERNLLLERQKEGIEAARRAGKKLGRPTALSKEKARELRAKAEAGESKTGLAKEYGISRATLYRLLAEEDVEYNRSERPGAQTPRY